jgi:hypothetical protein
MHRHAPQDWAYRGKKRCINTSAGGAVDIAQLMSETDVVVLTQVWTEVWSVIRTCVIRTGVELSENVFAQNMRAPPSTSRS